MRVLLFVFTCIGWATATGFVLLLISGISIHDENAFITISCFLCAAGSLAALELAIPNARPYHAGYNNALLYAALLATGTADALHHVFGGYDFHGIADSRLRPLLLFAGALLATAIVRYADRATAAAGFVAGLLLLANLALPLAPGRTLLPFLLMKVAAGTG